MRPLLDLVASYGVSSEQLLENLDVPGSGSSTLTSADNNLWLGLLERAVSLTGDPAIALKYGQYIQLSDIGPLGFAIMNSADIESVLRMLIRYHPIISLDLDWQFVETPTGATLRVDVAAGNPSNRVLIVESVFSSIKRLGEILLHGGLPPIRLQLDYSPPSYSQVYVDIFAMPPTFDAEYCGAEIPQEVLKHPLDSANPEAQVVVMQQCELILEQMGTGGSLATKVRWLLVQSCSSGIDVSVISSKLHMSERTLRRKLAKEGTSFSALQDEVRNALAVEYLRNTQLSATDIAILLGYTDRANFNRAFSRWNGVFPGVYREALAGA
jgi:AraC-like DNA-binding protein